MHCTCYYRYSVATSQHVVARSVAAGDDHLLLGFQRLAGDFFWRIVEWVSDETVESDELRLAHDDITARPIDKKGQVSN